MINPSLTPDTPHLSNNTQRWSKDELTTLGIAVALLGLLVVATALFGFYGLISVALLMVAGVFVILLLITQG